MTLEEFNRLPIAQAEAELLRCCGSRRWAEMISRTRPYETAASLFAAADRTWNSLSKDDWLEAFSHHPRIGDANSLRAKFEATSQWAREEQKGAASASEETLQRLAKGNSEYEKRFGHIFLVCATGKSAEQMLRLLESRLNNDPEPELKIASAEQAKITRIRLEKLLS